jgi:hypothetical protein
MKEMFWYRLLILSAVFMLPLGASAIEPAGSLAQKERPSEAAAPEHHHHAAPKHHHHHGDSVNLGTQKEEQPALEKKTPAQTKEKTAVDEKPAHPHKHESAAEADAKTKSSPTGEEAHIHHMMDKDEHHMMDMHEHHMMDMDAGGMVMNENKDDLPRDCPKLAGDVEITVRAGIKYAKAFPGTMYGYDQYEWNVKPCTRITVTLINEDNIRHQWMVHMLPTYIYPQGMFHLEVSGPGRRTGTFIVPSVEKTYFVHCDIAQHTEKGMKAQLKVGGGDQDFPSIPGITAPNYPDSYETETSWSTIGSSLGAGIVGLILAIGGLGRFKRRAATAKEVVRQPQVSKPEAKPKQQKWWPF